MYILNKKKATVCCYKSLIDSILIIYICLILNLLNNNQIKTIKSIKIF